MYDKLLKLKCVLVNKMTPHVIVETCRKLAQIYCPCDTSFNKTNSCTNYFAETT